MTRYSKILLLVAAVSVCAATLCPALLPAQEAATTYGLPNLSGLVERLTPVTVNISTTKILNSGYPQFGSPFGAPHGQEQMDPFRDYFGDDFFRRFFGDRPNREYKQKSLGSGFIIDAEGFILTNNHVVEDADEITVKTHDDTEYDAEIIGRDPKTDLALIKIKKISGELPASVLGDSDALKVGEWVIAIGNPFGLQETVTSGIVSAKWRKIGAGPYEDFIQTDASINPGNSGGPLFNLQGEVVGVNTMIYSPSGGNVGIGFAIPINLAKNVVQQLKEKGRVVRGWLGVVVQTVTPELAQSFGLEEGSGALIADVDSKGPAGEAGILSGDIITKFDGKEVKDMSDLPLMVAQTQVGKKVKVVVLREGKPRIISVTIGELQEKQSAVVRQKSRPQLGMMVRRITPEMAARYGLSEDSGIIVTDVEPGSPAGEAGIRKGDIIKEVNRKEVETIDEYSDAIQSSKSENLLLLIKRGRTSLWVVVKPTQ